MHFDQPFFESVITDAKFYGDKMPNPAFFCVDSRKIKQGDIFVAIKGLRVDGHDYLEDAIKLGAKGLVIAKDREDVLLTLSEQQKKFLFIAVVKNPELALIELATKWRLKFEIPVVGITGSVGKTSTKQMLSNICDVAGINYISAEGNQNTALLTSLNILKITSEHKVAIFELGISKIGEMAKIAHIVKPTIGIITYIGHSHMEGLGSLSDIATEKREIFKYFNDTNIGIINGDQPVLSSISYNHPIIKFGSKMTNQIQARKLNIGSESLEFVLKLYNHKFQIILNTNHEARVANALAASSAAYILGIKPEFIIKGITIPIIISGRFDKKLLKNGKGQIINDAYNASPESMKAALQAFDKINFNGQKIVILGDMLELGINSPFWHRQVGRFLKKVPSINQVLLVGDLVKWTHKSAPLNVKIDHVSTWQEAIKKLDEKLDKKLDKNYLVLVKASRGMQLQKLVEEVSI